MGPILHPLLVEYFLVTTVCDLILSECRLSPFPKPKGMFSFNHPLVSYSVTELCSQFRFSVQKEITDENQNVRNVVF